jgi:hypothetical protein
MIAFIRQFRLKYVTDYEEKIICIPVHLLKITGQILHPKISATFNSVLEVTLIF